MNIKLKNNYLLLLPLLGMLLLGCQPKVDTTTLDGKYKVLKSKQEQLSQLEKEIAVLNKEIKKISPQKEKKKQIVTTKQVKKTNFVKYIEIQSTVMAEDNVNVSSEVPGRIIVMNVKEGDYVKRGQLIAKLNMESIKKQVAELEVSLDLAKTIYERQSRLWEQNIGSEMQYLQAKNGVERLEKSIETINYQLSKANVYAPISGYVDRVILTSGELASPGMPIIQVLNTHKVKAVAEVPENYLGKIKKGDYVNIYIPVLDQEQKVKVSLLGRTINTNNRTFKVEANLKNANNMLKPNLLVNMKIKEIELNDVIVIPSYFVQQDIDGKDFLYVVEQKGNNKVAHKRIIKTAESNIEGVLITSGIEEGDVIIDEGARNVVEGTELIITNHETNK